MRKEIKMLLFPLILVLGLGSTITNAEDKQFLVRPNSISFKGENQNWFILHQMYLKGTEIEVDTKIIYKGNVNKIKNLPFISYSIYGNHGFYGSQFSYNNSNEFQSKRMSCGGCKYLDKEREVTVVLYIDGNQENLILTRE
jgi:hypothetical protein